MTRPPVPLRRTALMAAAGAAAIAVAAPPAMAADPAGAVYVQTNRADANTVVVFARHADGLLERVGRYRTGGLGAGAGLGSQGAVALAGGGRWLLAVNAGSDEVTSFRVRGDRLARVDTAPSGGDRPISLDVHGGIVYVLNTGGAGNISALRLGDHGGLHPFAGSTRPLSGAGVDPAQVAYRPDGAVLVVTEKATNRIVTYRIGEAGRAHAPRVHASAAPTPFGFDWSGRRLVVSDAAGGAPDASGLSSYWVGDAGALTTLTAFAPTTETAACWVAIAGRYAYTTNTGSGTVSGYRIAPGGHLSRLDADGVTAATGAGSAPADADVAGRFLYVREGGTRTVSAWRRGADGSLTFVDETTMGRVAGGAAGLVAR